MSQSLLTILAQGAAAAGDPPAWTTFVPIVGMVAVFWFLMIRPQMRQQKAQRDKIGGIQRGDQIVTAGGLIGKVTKVEETVVEVELAPGMKVKAVRSTISDVMKPGGSAPAND